MTRFLPILFAALGLLTSCAREPVPEPVILERAQPVSFLHDVKPVLDSRCVVCHSCYNAACQLKLSSYEGVDRGASKDPVYSGSRLSDQAPTRLFIDAQSTAAWRDKGFYSVTRSEGNPAENPPLMAWFLDAKRRTPVPEGRYQAEASDLTCAADTSEVRKYLGKHPGRGMPFGFPAVSDAEHEVLMSWMAEGAQGPTAQEQAELTTPSAASSREIAKWEAFLNGDDPKTAITARYLYEHFFLAHLRFSATGGNEFFRLVRSTTGPGEPIVVIPTVRPYDDPGVERFFYRFEKIHSTIVYKTHIVVGFDDRRLNRYRELFLDPQWLETPHRMPYEDRESANPFVTFAQIPPRVRYQFMLDHSEYIIRTFIRGPVCRGQIAVNVINDHFWVMFLDPDADETIKDPDFLLQQADNLRLPTERGSDVSLLDTFSNAYRERYANFYKAKNALYDEKAPLGPDIDALWRGNVAEDSPFLTIYRHFDSASVLKGALGDLPRTAWVIDYPQFERIYYSLVAGFDVFGNVAHQANVRRYMDYLRIEGELNFVKLLPREIRAPTMASWYIGTGVADDARLEEVVGTRPTRVRYTSDDPQRELIERVVEEHLLPETGIGFDRANYHASGQETELPTRFSGTEDLIAGFHALNEPGTGFIRHVTSTEANVLFVRIRGYDGPYSFFSIVINRWHDNVNSMFRESKRLDPARDTIDFLPGSIGAYPNYFLDVAAEDVPEFFDMLKNFDGSPEYRAKLNKYGINRMDERFWSVYDWFQQRMNQDDPVHTGLLDLNRYFSQSIAD